MMKQAPALLLLMSSSLLAVELFDETKATTLFAFDNVALGDFRLVGRDGALAASDNGPLAASGDVVSIDLVLGPSGSITGRLDRLRRDRHRVPRAERSARPRPLQDRARWALPLRGDPRR